MDSGKAMERKALSEWDFNFTDLVRRAYTGLGGGDDPGRIEIGFGLSGLAKRLAIPLKF